jgi:tetratricopeptide (TPR) repeat protein
VQGPTRNLRRTSRAIESEAGELWLVAVGSEGGRAILAGQLNEAYEIYERIRRCLEAVESINTKGHLAVTYHQLGMVAHQNGDFDTAERWLCKSLRINRTRRNQAGIASACYELGLVAQFREDFKRAKRRYQRSLRIYSAQGDQPRIAGCHYQLGMVAQLQNDLDSALRFYDKALKTVESLKDLRVLAGICHQIGTVAQYRGEWTTADRWYRQALEINTQLKNHRGLSLTYAQLGLLAEQQGDLNAALDWMIHSLSLPGWFPQPGADHAPQHLVRIGRNVGLRVVAESWKRLTGADLPTPICEAIAAPGSATG